MALMQSNLERGFWRLALGISCVWWVGVLCILSWMMYTERHQLPVWKQVDTEITILLIVVGAAPIVLFYLVRWIARGFRAE